MKRTARMHWQARHLMNLWTIELLWCRTSLGHLNINDNFKTLIFLPSWISGVHPFSNSLRNAKMSNVITTWLVDLTLIHGRGMELLRIQDSVQILIPLNFYSSQFILLIFHSCKHLQSAGVCCDSCDCTFSQECDSVTSALFQRLRYKFMGSSLFFIVSYFSFRQFIR